MVSSISASTSVECAIGIKRSFASYNKSHPNTKINVRIGIGVIMEEFEGTEILQGYVEQLGELSRHEHASVRADACHYLALTGSEIATDYLKVATNDENPEVREIAVDGLEALNS